MVINAAVNQIIDKNKDKGFEIAAPAMTNLIYFGENGGLLQGLRLLPESK